MGLAGLTVGNGRLCHSGHVFLFVGQRSQGWGVGTRLLEALLDLADNWLVLRRVELTVVVENERARRLYERRGCVIEGQRNMSVIAQGNLNDEFLIPFLRVCDRRELRSGLTSYPAVIFLSRCGRRGGEVYFWTFGSWFFLVPLFF